MSTDNNEWIKMSDRRPTEADLPVCAYAENQLKQMRVWTRREELEGCDFIHYWRRITLPAPPKPEPTQEQSDSREYQKWQGSYEIRETGNAFQAWMAGIAYRDAQNRADHEQIRAMLDGALKDYGIRESATLNNLRRRCGLDT